MDGGVVGGKLSGEDVVLWVGELIVRIEGESGRVAKEDVVGGVDWDGAERVGGLV